MELAARTSANPVTESSMHASTTVGSTKGSDGLRRGGSQRHRRSMERVAAPAPASLVTSLTSVRSDDFARTLRSCKAGEW